MGLPIAQKRYLSNNLAFVKKWLLNAFFKHSVFIESKYKVIIIRFDIILVSINQSGE